MLQVIEECKHSFMRFHRYVAFLPDNVVTASLMMTLAITSNQIALLISSSFVDSKRVEDPLAAASQVSERQTNEAVK